MQNTTYEWYTKDGQKEIRDNEKIIKKCWVTTSVCAVVSALIFAILRIWSLLIGSTDDEITIVAVGIVTIAFFITSGIAIILGIVSLIITLARNVNPIRVFSKLSSITFVTSIITLIICPLLAANADGWGGLAFAFPMFAAIYGTLPVAFISFITSICLKEQQKHRKKIGERGTEENLTVNGNTAYEWYTKSKEREIRDNEKIIKIFSLAIIVEFAVAFLLFILNRLRASDELSALIVTCFYAVLGIGISTAIARFVIIRTDKVGPIQSLSIFSLTTLALSVAILIGCPMFSNIAFGGMAYKYPMHAANLIMLPVAAIGFFVAMHLKVQQERREKIYQNKREGIDENENIQTHG